MSDPSASSLRSRILSGVSAIGTVGRLVGDAFRTEASAPFSGGPPAGPANIPPPDYLTDQPAPPKSPPEFRKGYHDRTLQNWAAPINFGGRTIEITRADIEAHDSGASFLGSSIFAVSAMRHPTVYSALGIRCAPSIALPRNILGGTRGLSRVVRAEVEAQLCPRMGLLPSPCFPGTLWGTIAIDLALMGFAVLQHVYGPPDARGVRRVYTRRWPTWAVWYMASRRTYIAMTMDGPVDINTGDGKFTLIGKSDTPHLQGAVRALMLPVLDGVQVIQARAQWIDRFADPKFIATLPEDIAARSDIGRALYAAIATMRGPGGYGVLPHGTDFKAVGLEAKASKCFEDALKSDDGYINCVLTGVNTSADGGVYKPLVFWGILRSTVGDDLAATNRGINQGHVYPYTRFNYEAGIEEAEERGTWVDPVLDTPLPDPEADARNEAFLSKLKGAAELLKLERENGAADLQARASIIYAGIGEPVPQLAIKRKGGAIEEYHIKNKIVAPDEDRADLGLDPLPDGAGSVKRLAEERLAGKDQAGTKASQGDATVDGKPPTVPAGAEPATPPVAPGADSAHDDAPAPDVGAKG